MHLAAGIQLKSCAPGALAVFCKDTLIRQLAWNVCDFDSIKRSDTVLLFTGAKAYRRGNGWWTVSGYAPDASDVRAVEDRVKHLINVPFSGTDHAVAIAP